MATPATSVSAFDSRPFFDKALRYGVEQDILTPERLQAMQADFAKGIVQIAHYFGTAHLRPELELALHRMINLISLYLENLTAGDLRLAAYSLRDKTFLSHSKGGSEMLKLLHAMPESTVLAGNPVTPESQRAYLDEKTAAKRISLAEYQADLARRQENQNILDFSFWLAKKMGADSGEMDDADALIRSALLVIAVDKAELRMPTRTHFVRLVKAVKAAKNASAEVAQTRLETFVKNAPSEFQSLARREMARFVANDLPKIRQAGNSADKLLNGDSGLAFFVNVNLDEDVREYERLVAKEWDRVTRGKGDDPAVLASIFLCLATGQPAKAAVLLKEAKAIIQRFRTAGFDSAAVLAFIEAHAPEALRDDLRRFWLEDLMLEAQEQLADADPNWPDAYMERALEYFRQTCNAAWKGRRR